MAIYDTLIAPHLDASNNGLVDASALLWRLELRRTESSRRWHEVMRLWQRRRTFGSRAFDVIHAVIAFAAANKHAFARKLANRVNATRCCVGAALPKSSRLPSG